MALQDIKKTKCYGWTHILAGQQDKIGEEASVPLSIC